ncbi:hypothetical protein PSHT_03488 [Puccinia striiformis]|uniref:Uncharacterized protein n=1 Tax=Puccinia striiformis TaxID=27350 RepID=A0A2S4WFJ6_9BASI|nr:hypothetical protein PSHT_03488 [Puccinia striiformis]
MTDQFVGSKLWLASSLGGSIGGHVAGQDHASDSSYKLAQNLKATSSHDDHGGSEKGAPITLVTILCNSGQRHLSKF